MLMLKSHQTYCATDALRAHACQCHSQFNRQASQVLVVANPANTNALILKENAPSIPAENITCLTRLDHNRALGQVGLYAAPASCLMPCCDGVMGNDEPKRGVNRRNHILPPCRRLSPASLAWTCAEPGARCVGSDVPVCVITLFVGQDSATSHALATSLS